MRSEIPGANFGFVNRLGLRSDLMALSMCRARPHWAPPTISSSDDNAARRCNQGDAASALTVHPLDLVSSTFDRRASDLEHERGLHPGSDGDLVLANADLRTTGDLRIEGD